MHSNASIAWDYYDGCVFVAHQSGPIVDDDFGAFLDDVRAQTGIHRVVVRASEGVPKAAHRTELLHWYRDHTVRASILTSSPIARGGVTALSWFGAHIRAFPPNQLEQALDFVEIVIEHWPECRQRLQAITRWVDRHRLELE